MFYCMCHVMHLHIQACSLDLPHPSAVAYLEIYPLYTGFRLQNFLTCELVVFRLGRLLCFLLLPILLHLWQLMGQDNNQSTYSNLMCHYKKKGRAVNFTHSATFILDQIFLEIQAAYLLLLEINLLKERNVK